MRREPVRLRLPLVILLTALLTVGLWPYNTPVALANGPESAGQELHPGVPFHSAAPEEDGFVIDEHDGRLICRDATPQEAREMAEHDQSAGLHVIPPIRLNDASGLKINLRATPQLDSFPQA